MKIAVFRALKFGDLLCSVPSLRALRAVYPRDHIALISLPWAEDFAARFNKYIDEFIEFPGFPGLPEREYSRKDITDFIKKMRERNFDLLLQMHGDGSIVNPLLTLLGARKTAGFYTKGSFCPDPASFTLYPSNLPEIKRLLSLLEFLGVNTDGEELEFPLFQKDIDKLKMIFRLYGLQSQKYVCIHPGSISSPSWNPLHFVKVADTISSWGFKIILTGIKEESKLTRDILKHMKSKNAVDLAGKTDMGLLAALLKNAYMLICSDTGISHLADALKVPSVVVFTASNPDIWAPFNRRLHRVVTQTSKPEKVLKEATYFRRVYE